MSMAERMTISTSILRALPVIALVTVLGSCGENGGGGSGGRVTYTIGGTTSGFVLGTKTPLTLVYTPDDAGVSPQTVQISANGAWAFNPVQRSSGTVTVKAQPSALDQTCLLSNGTSGGTAPDTSLKVSVGPASVTTLQVTCSLTSAFSASATLSGLPTTSPTGTAYSAYNVILYLTVTDIYGTQRVGKMVPPDGPSENGVPYSFVCGTAPCSFTDGSTYQASIEQPTATNNLIPENCVLTSQSARGVIAEDNIQVQVQCKPVGRFLYVTGGGGADGNLLPFQIDPKTGALTPNGLALATGGVPATLSVLPASATIDPNNPPSTSAFAYLVSFSTATLSGYSISYSKGTIAPLNPASVATGSSPWVDGGGPQPFNGNVLYVTGGGTIQGFQIDSSTGSMTAGPTAPSGNAAWGNIVFTPDGKFGYQVASEGIHVYSVDPGTGTLTPQGSPISAYAPLWLTVDPRGRFAYLESFTYPVTDVYSYQIDPNTGQLSPIGGPTFDAGTAYGAYAYAPIFIDPSGTYALLLNDNDNVISVFVIHADGTLTVGPGSPFQPGYWLKAANLVFSPGGRFAYALAQGSSNIAAYSVNLTPANGEPALTFVGLYSTGGTVYTLGTPLNGTNPNDLAIEPSGRFLYVCNGVSNTIGAFYIDPNSGELTPVLGSPFPLPSGGSNPRNITFLP
jgi:6-phosphogluconolactonase (cycloisomerase 2 family)